MPRYYRRRYRSYRSGKQKYSNETISFSGPTGALSPGDNFPASEDNVGQLVVPATTVYGTRKVKNFEIQVTTEGLTSPVIGCLVYVPEGTTANEINKPITGKDVTSVYEPNQNLIKQFIIPASAYNTGSSITNPNPVVTKVKTSLARNLDSGDEIRLIFCAVGDVLDGAQFAGTVNYAIKY